MATGVLQSAASLARDPAAESFFESYRWCLNPMLTVRELLRHLGHEIESYLAGGDAGWQAAERRINLYLFVCAIACTLDDYLARRPWDLSSVARRLPAARIPVDTAEMLLNAPHACRSWSATARVAAWRRRWTRCVDAACELLLNAGDAASFSDQAGRLLSTASTALDEPALAQRMRIPEAFRCQDLTHYDVCEMVRLCLPALPEKQRPVLILGPRTAGAYFAPLTAAWLRARGYAQVTWLTTRPKNRLSRAESRAITQAVRARARILIIDDHPNSGHTLRLLLTALRDLGAASQDMIVALPGHPSIPSFALTGETARGVRLYMLPPDSRYKARLLAEHFNASPSTRVLNRGFAARYAAGFQVRLKCVFESGSGPVMAKSVGWGWLGYHAWLAGMALQDFVPPVLRLRDGILFSHYIAAQPAPPAAAAHFGRYIARRVNTLALPQDPALDTPGYRWCGWDDLAATLSRIYGPRLAPFKKPAIRRRLRSYAAPRPTLVDGRMQPVDWIAAGNRLLKTDFEHHNFGGGELDIVDPAWDLASAIFESQLSPDAETALLESYIAETADADIARRLPLYKILYAMNGLRAAKYWLARDLQHPRREQWNRQFVATRSFAAFHLARYCGRRLHAAPPAWGPRLCFLDLDGVLDWGLLGFPHTTASGLQALQLLHDHGFSVVLNTARSLEHVREYCRAYRLPGGVAELGSVFWDAVRDWAVPLIDTAAAAQLDRLRPRIQSLPGVFIDPENLYSIRAYRFQDGYMRPLRTSEAAALLDYPGCSRLTFIQSQADTYIVQKGAGKGPALATVRDWLGCARQPVAAVGDSALDVEMLRAAEYAFAPRNASPEVRALVSRGQCRLTRRPLQAGLLEAAMELCQAAPPAADPSTFKSAKGRGVSRRHTGEELLSIIGGARRPVLRVFLRSHTVPASLLDELLRVPDRHPLARILRVLNWRGL